MATHIPARSHRADFCSNVAVYWQNRLSLRNVGTVGLRNHCNTCCLFLCIQRICLVTRYVLLRDSRWLDHSADTSMFCWRIRDSVVNKRWRPSFTRLGPPAPKRNITIRWTGAELGVCWFLWYTFVRAEWAGPVNPAVSSINIYQTMESYIKIKLHSQFFAIAGLSIGLLATLFGLHMSSAIESTPALMGLVFALWGGVSASIIGGRVKKYSVS